jgi:predicted  nucleic acid-binding Zn-ribbon protein
MKDNDTLREEIQDEITNLKEDLEEEIYSSKKEIEAEIWGLKSEIRDLTDKIIELEDLIEQLSDKLLTNDTYDKENELDDLYG